MKELNHRAVVLSLIEQMDSYQSWCGETHIQKCGYFLQEVMGVNLEMDFVLYRHGPFSFNLRELLGELTGLNLLSVFSREPYGPSLQLTDYGRSYLARFPRSVRETRRQVDRVATRLGPKDVSSLERLATALYVIKNDGSKEEGSQAQRINELKPHISVESAAVALREVNLFLADAKSERVTLP